MRGSPRWFRIRRGDLQGVLAAAGRIAPWGPHVGAGELVPVIGIDQGISPGCGLTRPYPSAWRDPLPDPVPLVRERFVRVVRQGGSRQAQRQSRCRALEIRRAGERRRRPARCSPSSRRRPSADHPNGPLNDNRCRRRGQRPGGTTWRLNPRAEDQGPWRVGSGPCWRPGGSGPRPGRRGERR